MEVFNMIVDCFDDSRAVKFKRLDGKFYFEEEFERLTRGGSG